MNCLCNHSTVLWINSFSFHCRGLSEHIFLIWPSEKEEEEEKDKYSNSLTIHRVVSFLLPDSLRDSDNLQQKREREKKRKN